VSKEERLHEQVVQPPGPVAAPGAPAAAPSLTAGFSALGNAAVARRLAQDPYAGVRAATGAATGFDLSDAPIRPGSALADEARATALTFDGEVHLGTGLPGPETSHGHDVVAHELAHVVQQRAGAAGALREPGGYDRMEREADRVADRAAPGHAAAGGGRAPLPPAVAAPALQAYDPRYHRRALVKGLTAAGTFSAADIGRIYQENWMRDLSQASPLFASVMIAWKRVKLAAMRGQDVQPAVDRLYGTAAQLKDPKIITTLATANTYGGYRPYEHMDNPLGDANIAVGDDKADPEDDAAASARKAANRARKDTLRAELLATPPGESMPQYLVDNRDFINAELIAAAEAAIREKFGSPVAFSKDSASGKARDAWDARKKKLDADYYPQANPVLPGDDASVIAEETEEQAKRYAAAGPGADFDGDYVYHGDGRPGGSQAQRPDGSSHPAPVVVPPQPGPGPPGPAPIEAEPADLSLSGPAFHTEVDKRFWAATGYKVGKRLDPKLDEDKPYVAQWLKIRDQVRAERNAVLDKRRAEAEAKRAAAAKAKQDGTPGAPPPVKPPEGRNIPDASAIALGRASHSLEDFFSHSNFVEIAIGFPLHENPLTKVGDAGKPVDPMQLSTSTFDANDQAHALSNKIRAAADEMETEAATLNRVLGGRTKLGKKDVGVSSDNPLIQDPVVPPALDHGGGNGNGHKHDDEGVLDRIWEEAGEYVPYQVKKILSKKNLSDALDKVVENAEQGWDEGGQDVIEIPIPGGAPIRFKSGVLGKIVGGAKGLDEGVDQAVAENFAIPAVAGVLRAVAEALEHSTRDKQTGGGHTEQAEDQGTHGEKGPQAELKQIRFAAGNACAAFADQTIIGAMPKVFAAASVEAAEAEMAAVSAKLKTFIGPPTPGHPCMHIVNPVKKRAAELIAELAAKGEEPAGGHAH
jgi:hypothetical protein